MKALAWIPLLLLGTCLAHAQPPPSANSPNPLAIVTRDGLALRAEARPSAARHAVLWQGENLEVRGHTLDYLQVYDHRIERAGFVRASQVRIISMRPADAPELLAIVRFLRDTPGSEALGIAYTAAYLKAAPGQAIDAEPFAALGVMADRLSRRASANHQPAQAQSLSGQLEVVADYGVAIRSIDRHGSMRLCCAGRHRAAESHRRAGIDRSGLRRPGTCADPAGRVRPLARRSARPRARPGPAPLRA